MRSLHSPTCNAVCRTVVVLCCFFSGMSNLCFGAGVIVIRPTEWTEALKQWKTYREGQGHEVFEIDSTSNREALTARIREVVSQQPSVKFVMIAADTIGEHPLNEKMLVDPYTRLIPVDVPIAAKFSTPTFYHPSEALVQVGGEPWIATDNDYGDLDGDGIPELAVGRISADSSDELKAFLDKVIRYESSGDRSQWQRNIDVVAGVGGFGFVADRAIEMTTRQILTGRIPNWSKVSMTLASTSSHYCPNPWKLNESCVRRINGGSNLWIYIGHGSVCGLDFMLHDESYFPILTHRNAGALQPTTQSPIAIFLACYTGAFDAPYDSLAENFTQHPYGPVASIAASRVSGPYGMSILADGMIEAYYNDKVATLGECLLQGKRSMKNFVADDLMSESIASVATALTPDGYSLPAERQEHVWMMNLIGDPMTRLNCLKEVPIQHEPTAEPGTTLEIQFAIPEASTARIELVYPRGRVSDAVTATKIDWKSDEGCETGQTRYNSANDDIIAWSNNLEEPSDKMKLKIPASLKRGKYGIRLYGEGKTDCYVGYSELTVRAPAKLSNNATSAPSNFK